MATNNREAIEDYMNITGLSEPVAVQKLELYDGDLNEAVNAHFIEAGRNVSSSVQDRRVDSHDDLMDINETLQTGANQSLSHFSGTINPFSILDSTFGRGLSDGDLDFSNESPWVTHAREVREIPIGFKDVNQPTNQSGPVPAIEEVTGNSIAHNPDFHGTVIVDDDDDVDTTTNQNAQDHREQKSNSVGNSLGATARTSAPGFGNSPDFGIDIEEEMIHAAIEASKREVELRHPNHVFEAQTADQEKASHEPGGGVISKVAPSEPSDVGLVNVYTSNERLEAGSSSVPDESEDVDTEPLVWQRSRDASSGTIDLNSDVEARNPASTGDGSSGYPEHNTSSFPTDEWGGMSSEEHDEAVMLEAAMFGGIPEGSRYHYAYAPHQFMQQESPYPRPTGRPPSPSLTAQRLIREQQDDEYLASLQADREKELRAKEEAEAASEDKRRREEEVQRKLQEEQELERQLAAKEVSLPQEPSSDDENGATLLVRMPDGSRRGRRFLKSDSLQSLFDFIDVARVVKPGTYRLVRPYPRRAFSDDESSLPLKELGLTSKQEALFLELI